MAVDTTTIYLFTAGIVVLVIVIVTLINKRSGDKEKPENEGRPARQPVARQAMDGPAGVRRRAPRGNRMRLNQQDDSDEDDGGDAAFDDIPETEGKVGAKKLKKLQEKAEKKVMREQQERDREDRKKKDKEYEEERKAREEIEKQEEAVQEEEDKKQKEEQERIEHEEYLKMKDMFSVDEEGEGDLEADLNSESLLEQFINYIKETKVVMLEDLAGHFKLRTQDVINRVQDLQAEGRLTGVVDDRGKFIYITMVELEAVARYIRQNGRVSISDLAASSNRLINLEPETSSVALKMAAAATELSEQPEPIATAN